nr:F-box/FBD/LRR-repeat protein At1g13570-like [Ipomoea batatas]
MAMKAERSARRNDPDLRPYGLCTDRTPQHGRLVFDWEFLQSVQQCQDDAGRTLVKIVHNILFFRTGPIKKFTLQLLCDDPKPQQSTFDKWCRFLSRNGVEELNLSLGSYAYRNSAILHLHGSNLDDTLKCKPMVVLEVEMFSKLFSIRGGGDELKRWDGNIKIREFSRFWTNKYGVIKREANLDYRVWKQWSKNIRSGAWKQCKQKYQTRF